MGFARRNTLKLPPALLAKVAAEAERRNVSQSTIVRESLERALADSGGRGEPSCADLAGALVGSFRSGRRDLSTNKSYSPMPSLPTHVVAARVIVDTGPIVALLDADDQHHAWVKGQFARLRPPLLTCEAVLTESCFLLARGGGDSSSVVQLVERGVLSVAQLLETGRLPD